MYVSMILWLRFSCWNFHPRSTLIIAWHLYYLVFITWPCLKRTGNKEIQELIGWNQSMGESWPQSLVQPSLRSVSNGDLSQDSPIQTSRSVNKSQLNSLLCVTSSLNPFTLSKLLANIANWASRRYVFS